MLKFTASTEAIAAMYGIQLPKVKDLPPSSLRSWLAHRVRAAEGANKRAWERLRTDPAWLQHAREANLLRVKAYREKKKLQSQQHCHACVRDG